MGRFIQVHTCKSIKFHSRWICSSLVVVKRSIQQIILREMPVADDSAWTSCEVLPTTECCPYLVSMGLFFFGEFKYEAGVLVQRSNQPLGVTQIDTVVVGHSKKNERARVLNRLAANLYVEQPGIHVCLKPNHHWAACYHHTNFLYQEIFKKFARLATQTKATPYQTTHRKKSALKSFCRLIKRVPSVKIASLYL